MHMPLKVLLPHLKSNSVWNMVHDPEKLTVISKIGLFYADGSQVSLYADDNGTLWMVSAFDQTLNQRHYKVSAALLRNIYIREYRYHIYIGDPLNIEFESYTSDSRYERIANSGKDYAEAAIGGFMILTALAVVGHATYKRFSK